MRMPSVSSPFYLLAFLGVVLALLDDSNRAAVITYSITTTAIQLPYLINCKEYFADYPYLCNRSDIK